MTKKIKNDIFRTHDKFYLDVDRKSEPKEYFKFILSQLENDGLNLNNKAVIDIGCATGDFLYYLRSKYPDAQLSGLEILPMLAEKAKSVVPDADILNGDISSSNYMPLKKYDFIFMLGVHSIFDDLIWLDNIKSMLNKGGNFYCFGLFNPIDIDVFIKARRVGGQNLESGWNILSISTIKDKLDSLLMDSEFLPWSIDIPILQNEADPFRSWTVALESGRMEIRNGLQINHTFNLLHAKFKQEK